MNFPGHRRMVTFRRYALQDSGIMFAYFSVMPLLLLLSLLLLLLLLLLFIFFHGVMLVYQVLPTVPGVCRDSRGYEATGGGCGNV